MQDILMTDEIEEKKKPRRRATKTGTRRKHTVPPENSGIETENLNKEIDPSPEASEKVKENSDSQGNDDFPEKVISEKKAKPASRKRPSRSRKSKATADKEAVEQDLSHSLNVEESSRESAKDTLGAYIGESDLSEQKVESSEEEPTKTPTRSRRRKKRTTKKSSSQNDQSSTEENEDEQSVSQVVHDEQIAVNAESFDNPIHSRHNEWLEDLDDESEEHTEDAVNQEFVLLEEPPEEIRKRVSKLLINAEEPEECRLALVENGKLESIHVSTVTRAQTKNNIYKARIVAIEANLQAAFVDYGLEKNGFLPFNEIHPEYYKENLSDEIRRSVDNHQWKRISINDVLDKGQELLVQVVKEEVGKKGANMTTYLSLPGRSVVLMPGSDSSGISRKIAGEERRSLLREAMNALEIPEGIGWIVRTASADLTKSDLSRDVNYLLKMWEEIKTKGQELEGVGLLYEDHQSVLRFLREHFDPSIEEILVDDQAAFDQVKRFISMLPENQQSVKVRLHKGARPIFNQFSIEDQIESIYQPRVNLPSGGSIVIDPTEALVAIDVNSGSTSKGHNFEESIFQANIEAAAELARQLRLRDLGGLIVVDFIDMRNKKHIRDVEQQVKRAMKRDKAKVDVSRISKFGLMQISRQKLGAPIEAGNYRICQHCKGRGLVRSVETLALFYLRRIQTGASRKNVVRVECRFPLEVASYLLNMKRKDLREMEEKNSVEIAIFPELSMKPADNEITFQKSEKDEEAKKQA